MQLHVSGKVQSHITCIAGPSSIRRICIDVGPSCCSLASDYKCTPARRFSSSTVGIRQHYCQSHPAKAHSPHDCHSIAEVTIRCMTCALANMPTGPYCTGLLPGRSSRGGARAEPPVDARPGSANFGCTGGGAATVLSVLQYCTALYSTVLLLLHTLHLATTPPSFRWRLSVFACIARHNKERVYRERCSAWQTLYPVPTPLSWRETCSRV